MTDAVHAAYSVYLRDMADLMGLRDWRIELSCDVADDGSRATVCLHRMKDEAFVKLGEFWLAQEPEQQRQSLCHELLHAHTTRLCRVVSRLSGLDDDYLRYVQDAHDQEEEIVVDSLARVLAPYLPLPPEVS